MEELCDLDCHDHWLSCHCNCMGVVLPHREEVIFMAVRFQIPCAGFEMLVIVAGDINGMMSQHSVGLAGIPSYYFSRYCMSVSFI
mmetsp:Transcript_4976/g.31826  ORF Transcript_4976/g.31826 Transcript_4976/m.31826 type:complete len:85 (-) Transcript_4976:192-446(-)